MFNRRRIYTTILITFFIVIPVLRAAPAAHASHLCRFKLHPAAANELYRTMLGRNATSAEVYHFTQTVIEGYQISQFEPLPTYPPFNFSPAKSNTCTYWPGRTGDPDDAGIPYLTTYDAGQIIDNQDEYNQNGRFSTVVIGLFRTYFCRLPKSNELRKYIDFYAAHKLGNGHFDRTGAQALIQYMEGQKILTGQARGPCWDVIDDIMERVLGRPPVTEGCDYMTPRPPDPSTEDPGHPGSVTSCYWFWLIANGWIATDDLLHLVRSSKEALMRNENADCYARNAVTGKYITAYNPFRLEPLGQDGLPNMRQVNPHAVGEYVTQIFRVLLGRFPRPRELADELSQYSRTGGDTKSFLHDIADRIINLRNPQNSLPQYSKYGAYAECVRQNK